MKKDAAAFLSPFQRIQKAIGNIPPPYGKRSVGRTFCAASGKIEQLTGCSGLLFKPSLISAELIAVFTGIHLDFDNHQTAASLYEDIQSVLLVGSRFRDDFIITCKIEGLFIRKGSMHILEKAVQENTALSVVGGSVQQPCQNGAVTHFTPSNIVNSKKVDIIAGGRGSLKGFGEHEKKVIPAGTVHKFSLLYCCVFLTRKFFPYMNKRLQSV